MITYKLHFIRTGRTSTDPRKRYVGQTDLPLCDKGRRSLQALREEYRYPPVEMLYTSPLIRCRETADILYPDTYCVALDGLKDMNLGEFEGKTFDELKGDGAFSAWLGDSFANTPAGGEETEAFTRRIVGAVDQIFRNMMDEGVTSAAVVTHGGVIMTLLAAVGLPKLPLHQWAVSNGTGYTMLMTPEMWLRDGSGEVFNFIPEPPMEDGMDMYSTYYNE